MSGSFEVSRLKAAQYLLILVILAGLLLDGMNIKLLAFATPMIITEWGVSKSQFGPALAAAMCGMAIGSSVSGWMGDRWGRRAVLAGSVGLFGIATVAAGFAHSLWWLAVLRFISGLGFGGVAPNGFALVVEWLPQRARAAAMSILTVGTPVGGLLGAVVVIWLLPAIGWRGCFIVCGIVTMMISGLMLAWLPESTRFLLKRGRTAAAQKEWRRIVGIGEVPPLRSDNAANPDSAGTEEGLTSPGLLRFSIAMAILYLMAQFVNQAFGNWLPTILAMSGWSVAAAITGTVFYNASAIFGGIVLVNITPRVGSRRLLLIVLPLTVLILISLTAALSPAVGIKLPRPAILALLAMGGFTCAGVLTVISLVATVGYPAHIRTTGIGLCETFGRTGGIVTVVLGGFLLEAGAGDPLTFFSALMAAACIAVAAALMVNRHINAGNRQSI